MQYVHGGSMAGTTGKSYKTLMRINCSINESFVCMRENSSISIPFKHPPIHSIWSSRVKLNQQTKYLYFKAFIL